jgi:hypothetical protein
MPVRLCPARLDRLVLLALIALIVACGTDSSSPAGNTEVNVIVPNGSPANSPGPAPQTGPDQIDIQSVEYTIDCLGNSDTFLDNNASFPDEVRVQGNLEVVDGRTDPQGPIPPEFGTPRPGDGAEVWQGFMDLPPGPCTIQLRARDNDGEVICTSTEPFNISADALTKVNLVLICDISFQAPVGSLDLDATFSFNVGNFCPDLFQLNCLDRFPVETQIVPPPFPALAGTTCQVRFRDRDSTCGAGCDPQTCSATPEGLSCSPGPDLGVSTTITCENAWLDCDGDPLTEESECIFDGDTLGDVDSGDFFVACRPEAFGGDGSSATCTATTTDGDADCDKTKVVTVSCPSIEGPCFFGADPPPPDCDDGLPCTVDLCDGTSGVAVCDNAPVPDGLPCTDATIPGGNGICEAGICVDASGGPLPALVSSEPSAGSFIVSTAWLALTFAEAVGQGSLAGFSMSCGGAPVPLSAHALAADPETVVINPAGELPGATSCEVSWPGETGPEALFFTTYPTTSPAVVAYDRRDTSKYAPFPDDYWLVPDATTPTGVRVDLPLPDREPDVRVVLGKLNEASASPDGFSPIGALVIELSSAPRTQSLPLTPTESLDPLAAIGIFDLNPGSPTYRERIPFQLHVRSAQTFTTPLQHALVLYPSIPLTPGGQYGLVITNRVLATATTPFTASSFTRAVLNDPIVGEPAPVTDVRSLTDDVLINVSSASPPIFDDDVALVTRFSVRSTERFPLTPLTMKEQVLAATPPTSVILDVRPDPSSSSVAAIVEGVFIAPEWRVANNIVRDANGLPVQSGTVAVPFVLAIPASAELVPAPITIYQHGNPGSAEAEVPGVARWYLGPNGFAVIGFTDTITREVGPGEVQNTSILGSLLTSGSLPEYWMQTTSEQFTLLRVIEDLADLDVLPLSQPDGQPDLDVGAALTYLGISEGANKGQMFVPYAPEVSAAALVAGGMRFGEVIFWQDEIGPGGFGTELLDTVNSAAAPNARPLDLWVGLSLFQLAFDPQDPHNHAAFVYANPQQVDGTFLKPSVLVQEGLGDTLVPNNASRSLAYTLGLGAVPHLAPIEEPVPFLTPTSGPLIGNIDPSTTSAFSQAVPQAYPGLAPTPGCEFEFEGHFCVQIAPSYIDQRVRFFQTAIDDPAPTISQ